MASEPEMKQTPDLGMLGLAMALELATWLSPLDRKPL
ncbi:hypothetical protein PF003_g25663 [Phytophthora fragariae]|nr:hypothetical protein PF003_g25663 [Phytophthora fragariae]